MNMISPRATEEIRQGSICRWICSYAIFDTRAMVITPFEFRLLDHAHERRLEIFMARDCAHITSLSAQICY